VTRWLLERVGRRMRSALQARYHRHRSANWRVRELVYSGGNTGDSGLRAMPACRGRGFTGNHLW